MASDRISDLFGGDDTQESVIGVIVRNEGGDVFAKDAYDVVTAINSVLEGEAPSDRLSFVPGRGASFSYIDSVIDMADQDGVAVAADEDVKDLYIRATTGPQVNPQFASLVHLHSCMQAVFLIG